MKYKLGIKKMRRVSRWKEQYTQNIGSVWSKEKRIGRMQEKNREKSIIKRPRNSIMNLEFTQWDDFTVQRVKQNGLQKDFSGFNIENELEMKKTGVLLISSGNHKNQGSNKRVVMKE